MTTWSIDELLPHAGRMILLDRVVAWDAERIVCERVVRAGDAFVDAHGFPAWAGVELMAQAIAAWNGCQVLAAGGAVRPGFLLGTRAYRADTDTFPTGTKLTVEAVRQFHDDDGMGAFACRIDAPGMHAEARLTVFSPPDPTPFLDPRNPLDSRGTPP
ncbi:hotdog family protein [Luteibacter sp. 329MFSha]|uniref:ApeP family dehydratase n=1 Tax=Luteibacter sp. 329MFSha TaxID=1798239 RepID=UPI0008D2A349|nr:hotdog family protein [Luteibacter sp. 329MFSha]SEV85606.1 Predicted 3-hydroxylacyl-ACP dehydratase, HotDog domain [Luteibacter sp. 329MFSha]